MSGVSTYLRAPVFPACGHPHTAANTYSHWNHGGTGVPYLNHKCRTCGRARNRARHLATYVPTGNPRGFHRGPGTVDPRLRLGYRTPRELRHNETEKPHVCLEGDAERQRNDGNLAEGNKR